MVAASVFKVAVALELFRQGADGELDVTTSAQLLPGSRTRGPTGISHFRDPVSASLRDLAYLMLTISDNAATDEIVHRVSIDRLNMTAEALGLLGTQTVSPLKSLLDTPGEDHGFAGWSELMDAVTGRRGPADRERAVAADLVLKRRALNPAQTNRTAQDMSRLLELIWLDKAGPPTACAEVRWMMAQQIDRSRLPTAFGADVVVSAKSGGLFGVVRNEVGVAEFQDGRRYAVAVFTRASAPFAEHTAINTAIGRAAAHLVASLRGEPS